MNCLYAIPLILVAGATLAGSPAAAKTWRIALPASPEERVAQTVAVKLPAGVGPENVLRDEAGVIVPLQRWRDGTAVFLVGRQRAGEKRTYELVPGGAGADSIATTDEKGAVRIAAGGQMLLEYRKDKEALPRADIDAKFKRAGYIHPLLTPGGKVVTGDYPSNHVHHHGVWSPWTKTGFQGRAPDFWNMQGGTGTVEFAGIDRVWSGPVHGGFISRQRMIDLKAPAPVAAIDEAWEVVAFAVRSGGVTLNIVDLTITQTCATSDPLKLPQYHYGGLGLRCRDEWNGKTAMTLLTSEGETDRVKANAQRMRWCYLGGAIDGGSAGVAVFDHPANFRAPQPVRVHPDMPYLSVTPSQLGDWAIEPGKPYVARYRFVVADGAPDKALLEACWNGYAGPAQATVEAN
ncbi:MAG: PmoA family protein [Verrucomicrobia bacterium]|nr:PmoA family protein [Verrucomicrobiota bacterium]